MRTVLFTLTALASASGPGAAQLSGGGAFEVASVRRTTSSTPGGGIRLAPGGRLTAQRATLQQLISTAYQIRDFQLSGGPAWLNSDRYDIEAKAEGAHSDDEFSGMLQVLLADRFHLVVHHETRELPIYRLTVAKGGHKLEPAHEGNCTPMNPPPAQVDPAVFRPCGGFNFARNFMMGGAAPLARLAAALSRVLGRTVVDQTGIGGSYDITLRWTPDDTQAFLATEGPAQAPPDASSPSLFTAIQEQLGLRLESGRGAVDVLVIDRADRPSEN